jgi:cholesterol transport system auxiliary component
MRLAISAIVARWVAVLFLAGGLTACGGASRVAYDLSATTPGPQRVARAQFRVAEPVATADLESDRILVRTGANTLAVLAGAQWADRLPALLRARLTESFENTRGLRVVGASAARDYDIETDIRAFELDANSKEVDIDVAVKLISARGRVVATRIFKSREPVASTEPGAVVSALDKALSGVMLQIVGFVASNL